MAATVQFGHFTIGEGCRPLVIAEAGINHNGDIEIARALVRAAKEAGADIVKFQTHIAAAEMLPDRGLAGEAGSHVTRSLFDIMTECHLSLDAHRALQQEAAAVGIGFLSTPFSVEAVDLLEELGGIPAYKVGSGEVTNLPFLDYIASKGKPVILSTGTADFDEVGKAAKVIQGRGAPLVLMQCTSNYPTPWSEVNLGVIDRMRAAWGVPVGLSDHCTGNYAAFGAVAKGACILEKHFTLSRRLPGVDQPSSMEPHELADLVKGVRAVWEALGDRKVVNEEAAKVRHGFSESVVTIAPVKAGETLAARRNIWVKRPGSGIPSYDLPKVDGRKATRDIPADTLLEPADFA